MDQLPQFLNGFEKYPFLPSQFPIKRATNQCQIPNKSKEKWEFFTFDTNPSCRFEFLQSKHLILLLLQLIFFAFIRVSHQSWDGIIVTQADYQALQAFKHEIIDPKGALGSWNDTGIGACSGKWFGIKCVRGQVISIQLPWNGLGGRITEKVGQFSALRKLSLHDNFIEGQVPWSLGFLPSLKGVSLFNNRLSGSVPPSICYCSFLQTLDLSNNSLTGYIPENLSNSTHLYRLNLSFNGFSGSIPMGLTRSASLTYLSLQHNNLSGLIPDTWGGGTKEEQNPFQLRSLVLDHNLLYGKVPVSLNRLKRLEEISLSNNRINGSIPEDIGALPRLQTLDLSNNDISGIFPASLSNLSSLILLNLEGNRLESRIPESIDKFDRLSVLKLRRNRFLGRIPTTLGNITSLSQLDLSENNFTGDIPPSLDNIPNLISFNVSYNNLSGPVPLLLSEKFNSSSFMGNRLLCGYSVSSLCPTQNPPPPSTPRKHRRSKLSTKDLILITLAVLLAVLVPVVCVLLYFVLRKRKASSDRKSVPPSGAAGAREKGVAGAGTEVESGGEAGGKLVHFDGPLIFTADDLLCATAEIMGKSTYGTVYKATLEDGSEVAVKRLREKIAKNQREFESEVNVLGKIRHYNLLALRAYYLGPKGEKLLVLDYMPKGNLSTFLHAREPETTVEWATRMKIVMGVTRGLFHLHNHENIIHGNLTSGNILLDQNTNPKISDFGLSRLMTTAANSNVIATAGALGYRAPELSKLKKANTKTDVYSLGVIILELLTGKSPSEPFNGADLPQWVASIVKEEWTNEVFDLELMRDTSTTTGDELLNTLKLALHCVDPSPAERPETRQILQHLEQIKPDLAAGSDDDGAGTSTAVE